jgi:D-alanyl-D-alanine carboxypeptidase
MTLNKLSLALVSMMSLALGCDEGLFGDGESAPATYAERSIALKDWLDELRAGGISGLLAEVDDGGRHIVARSGVARLDTAQPVDFDSYFRMGSNTKTFVAVVALQLVGEGALALDDTVDRWLPGVVAGHGNDGTRITVRQLLQHTSGLFNFTGDIPALFTAEGYLEDRLEHAEAADLVAIALRHEPSFAPGAGWEYSNTNYVLAGMIIERVTGRDWRDEVRARITAPLGLDRTFDPGDDPDLPEPHARAYEQFPGSDELVDVTSMNYTWADAAGSLVTTTRDLTQFWRALQQGKLLGPAEMAALHDTVAAPAFDVVLPGVRYGLGIMWVPTSCGGYWSHAGDTLGYATRNAASDDGSRVVVLSLSTQRADAALERLQETFRLLDQIMCAE